MIALDEHYKSFRRNEGISGAAFLSDAPPRSALSLELRSETRLDHEEIERQTGWPDSIKDREDYRQCLRGLLSIWRPFELALSTGEAWAALGIEGQHRTRREVLEHDLRALGDNPAHVPTLSVDPPMDLPGQIGVLYVLEGSALGGRVIRADVLRRLGPSLVDATAFFLASSNPSWRILLAAVDAFGNSWPTDRPRVLIGAKQTFAAFLQAFRVRCLVPGCGVTDRS